MTPATLPDVWYVSLSDNISLTDLAVEYIVYMDASVNQLPRLHDSSQMIEQIAEPYFFLMERINCNREKKKKKKRHAREKLSTIITLRQEVEV